MKARAGQGHIRREKDHHGWSICVYTGQKDAEGKPIRIFETVKGSETRARARLREILTEKDKGTLTLPHRLTIADVLDLWLNGYCKANCQERTQDGYETVVRLHLKPILGHILLKDLQARSAAIDNCYGTLLETLSHRTVLHIHRVLSEALKWAVEQRLIGQNPCALVHPPKARNKAMKTLEEFEVLDLLESALDDYSYPVIYTAIGTGLRQAELLGLRWRDMDLDLLSISVCQVLFKRKGVLKYNPPKTDSSRRQVAMAPRLATYLRSYKAEREMQYLEMGRVLGSDDLVFSGADGRPLDPSTLTHRFGMLVKKAGLDIRFHDLRHTYATLMLKKNIHPKVVQESLGHSSIAITLDLYSHVVPGLQDAAARQYDTVLPVGVVKRNGSATTG